MVLGCSCPCRWQSHSTRSGSCWKCIPASRIQQPGGCCCSLLCSLPQRQGLWECTSPRESVLMPLTCIPVILLGTTCSQPCACLCAMKSPLKLPIHFFSAGYTCSFLLSIPCPKYLLAPRTGYLLSCIPPILTREGQHPHI